MSEGKRIGNSFWVGIIIVSLGSFILLDRMDIILFPHWLFSWKTFLIFIGLIIGVNKQFKGIGWFVMILVGSFFLLEEIPGLDLNLREYIFPIIVIAVGLTILFRSFFFKSSGRWSSMWSGDEYHKKGSPLISSEDGSDDYIDLVSVFGSTKRRIFSKMFKGGDIVNIFGGTELDLSQADIEGNVVIDTVTIFGGVKILVPANWEVKSNITAILGGVEDKRMTTNTFTPSKKLVLTGTCTFGGVEIKSF